MLLRPLQVRTPGKSLGLGWRAALFRGQWPALLAPPIDARVRSQVRMPVPPFGW